jgi:BirA family biotin operon repressor/biotin-[acetyl-CoA-carboxylase] ligase
MHMTPFAMPRVEHLSSVDSTNAEAMRRALAGERGPLWILADTQTAGRGRAGRTWTSEPGNLQASLLWTGTAPASKAYQLALVAGLSVFDALVPALGRESARLRLKWPNDILISGAKAGGILIESSSLGSGAAGQASLVAVIGIGINVVSKPELPDRATACLAEFGVSPDARSLLDAIARSMAAWLAAWSEGDGFAAVRKAWLDRAHPIGERMAINTGSAQISGAFAGLDAEGALMLQTEAGVCRFTFGDVSLVAADPHR